MQNVWQRKGGRSDTLRLVLIGLFFGILFIAGGSSRADVPGQAIVRLVAWILTIICLWLPKPVPVMASRAPLFGLAALAALIAFQLIPLPPALWTLLPGRGIAIETAVAIGSPQPWRPISLSPSATFNSLGSLIVPLALILLARDLQVRTHRKVALILLFSVIGGCVLGLLQLSGLSGDNPFINDIRGMIGGNFANRNHFSLFLAIGIITLGLVVAGDRDRSTKVVLASAALLPVMLLMVIATGSRMGLLASTIGIIAALAMSYRRLCDIVAKSRVPSWILVIIPFVALVALIVASVVLGRAMSFDRAVQMDISQDFRSKAFPVLVEMVKHYFPIGSGFGTFDPVFRIAEPTPLLRPAYFNHAHNDWIEFVLDGGFAAVVLGLAGLGWAARRAFLAWTRRQGVHLAQAGSAILGVSLVASLSDYPLRTPMLMAVFALAAVWLSNNNDLNAERGREPR